MKKVIGIFIGVVLMGVLFSSCGEKDENATVKKLNAQQLYEKYKTMITEGDGCVPCVDCAALALAMSYNTQEEIKNSKKHLIEYFKKNGEIPCPELVPELKKEVAQIPK